jgi:hypothetical protein
VRDPRARFDPAPDGFEQRLRIALRLGNGAVFTARQCRALAEALGWPTSPDPNEAA